MGGTLLSLRARSPGGLPDGDFLMERRFPAESDRVRGQIALNLSSEYRRDPRSEPGHEAEILRPGEPEAHRHGTFQE